MSADDLVLFVNNDRRLYERVVSGVRSLIATLDRAAEAKAKANAHWHDDPEAEDHAEYHAPADVQFPRLVRDQAIRELVDYYLRELKR